LDLIDIRLYAPIATLFGVSVSFILWRLNQQRKVLSYQVVSRQRLVTVRGPARRKLQVKFDGKSVESAQLLMVRIFNSGNKSIQPGDYHTDLAIYMNPEAEIVLADVGECTPFDLEDRVRAKGEAAPIIKEVAGGKVMLTPMLLNPGDGFTLQLLVNNLTERLVLKGHIEGISRLRKWKKKKFLPAIMTNAGLVVMALAMLGVEPSALRSFGWQEILPFLLFFLLGYVILWAGLYWPGAGHMAGSGRHAG